MFKMQVFSPIYIWIQKNTFSEEYFFKFHLDKIILESPARILVP